jgi:sugar phosphate permease
MNKDPVNQRRKAFEQVKVYLLTYIAYALIHFEREFWSLSKKQLKNEKHIFTTEELSRFDFAELILYSIFLFVCGVIGDTFDQRKILTLAMLGLGVSFALLGLPGTLGWYNHAYFISIMAVIGTLNAMLWPCFIAILGCWFPKKTRGFLAGLWATCNNFGNIVGIQVGTQLLKVYSDWQWLLYTIGAVVFLWGIVLWLFLVPDPEKIGIIIQEYNEEEALVQVGAEPEMYNSLH